MVERSIPVPWAACMARVVVVVVEQTKLVRAVAAAAPGF